MMRRVRMQPNRQRVPVEDVDTPEEVVTKADTTVRVILSNPNLITAARYHGGVPDNVPAVRTAPVWDRDGNLGVLVVFRPDEAMEAREEDVYSERPAAMAAELADEGEQIIEDEERLYALNLLAYLYKEIRHEPPHLEVLDAMEHRHIMRHEGEEYYSGEVTACFRVFGDPDHYDDGRPKPPNESEPSE